MIRQYFAFTIAISWVLLFCIGSFYILYLNERVVNGKNVLMHIAREACIEQVRNGEIVVWRRAIGFL